MIRSFSVFLLIVFGFVSLLSAEDFPVDAFQRATKLEEKLALLPDLARIPSDEALSPEMRYLVALHLVRPHLEWSTLYPPHEAFVDHSHRSRFVRSGVHELYRWGRCHNGEDWMASDVPASLRKSVDALRKKYSDEFLMTTEEWYTWSVRDPKHPDIVRALSLLQTIDEEPWQVKAQRWEAELRRNNCVLTFDLAARFAKGEDAKIILDVRGAEKIEFEVFRVQDPKKMLSVCQRLGVDFIFRDYGLSAQQVERVSMIKSAELQAKENRIDDSGTKKRLPMPIFSEEQRTGRWSVNVADLPISVASHNTDLTHVPNKDNLRRRFDDNCSNFPVRIERAYRPYRRSFSSWRCDCLLTIPGDAIPEPGGYVLVATARGRRFFVPVLVDPLSLTLRRCDDGVLTQLSNHDGTASVAGADILALGQIGDATTDEDGIAWLRVFAKGDVSIVAHHQGQFAIGGFGDLFEGVYSTVERAWHSPALTMEVMQEIRQSEFLAELPKQFFAVLPQRTHIKPYDTIRLFCVTREMKWVRSEKDPAERFRSLERRLTPKLSVVENVNSNVEAGDKIKARSEFDADGLGAFEFETNQKRQSSIRNMYGNKGAFANRVLEISAHEEPPSPDRTYWQEGLPRFHRLDQKLTIPQGMKLHFNGKRIVDSLKFQSPGWHHLECSSGGHRIFVYADQEIPIFPAAVRSLPPVATWTNLSHESKFNSQSFWRQPERDVWALFDKRTVAVGKSFQVLLRLPHRDARVMLLMEGKTVFDYKVVATSELFQVIELAAKPEWGENFFLTAKLLPSAMQTSELMEEIVQNAPHGHDLDEIGRTRLLHVENPIAPALPLKITITPPTPISGKEGKVRLRVTDAKGRGQSARVVLAIIARPQWQLNLHEPDTPVHTFAGVFTLRYDHPTFAEKSWRSAGGIPIRPSREQRRQPDQKQEAVQEEQLRKFSDENRFRPALTKTYSAPALISPNGAKNTHQGRDDDVWLPEIATDADGYVDISVTWPLLGKEDAGYRISGIAIAGDDKIGVLDERVLRSND